jgi:hypothetical protein
MTESDELSSRLHGVASAIDVGDADAALAEITRTATRRRRRRTGIGVVAAASVVVAGISAIAWAGRSESPTVLVGLDPSTTPAPVIDSAPPTTSPPPVTTAPPPPPAETRIVQPVAAVGVPIEPNPYDAQNMGPAFVVPWRDGFLAGGASHSSQGLDAYFSTDGISWQQVDVSLPEGVMPYQYTVGGDRLVVVGNAPGRSATTVYSSSDLVNWTAQTIEPSPPPIALPEFVKPTIRLFNLVANGNGWIVEASQGVRLDGRSIVAPEDLPDIGPESALSVDADDNGVTVRLLGEADSTLQYTWDELGVSPEQSADILQAQYVGETGWWSATWDGAPVPAWGTGVPTAAGFVRFDGPTEFSADGVDWTRTATNVPGGRFPVALSYGDGMVVVDSDGDTPILHRLDARGELIEEIVIEGLAPVRIPFSASFGASSALVYSSTEATQPIQSMEHEGFRLTYDPAASTPTLELVDIATGEVLVAENQETFAETGVSSLTWNDDGITIADVNSGEVIVTFPNDVVQRSMDEISDVLSQFVPDLHLLATADGEQFVTLDLPEPGGDGMHQAVVNGNRALVGINGDWTLYELP